MKRIEGFSGKPTHLHARLNNKLEAKTDNVQKTGKNNQTKILYDVEKIHKGSRIKTHISYIHIFNVQVLLYKCFSL